MNNQDLISAGELLGLRDAELQTWVDNGLPKAREERAAERNGA